MSLLLDKVSDDLNLYMGGLFTLKRKDAIKACNITHILSVLRLPLDEELFKGYEHLVIEVDDLEEENILQYFPQTNAWIRNALDGGGAVLVHCAMGKSRSATILLAYLLSHPSSLDDQDTQVWLPTLLSQIRKSRPDAEPNPSFMHQLELFRSMNCPRTGEELDRHPTYQRWLYSREIENSRSSGVAPTKIRFEDECLPSSPSRSENSDRGFELKCKKCRRQLATSRFLSPSHTSISIERGTRQSEKDEKTTTCAHYFIDPLSWMRPELEKSLLEGRFECPKCQANVGKYAWQGMKCSCSAWIVPAISLAKSKVDEQKI